MDTKRDETKRKMLKIIKAQREVIDECGEFAPFVSKSFILNETINKLKSQGIEIGRTTYYKAIRNAGELKKQEYFLQFNEA